MTYARGSNPAGFFVFLKKGVDILGTVCYYIYNKATEEIMKKSNMNLGANKLIAIYETAEEKNTDSARMDDLNNTATFDYAELKPRYGIAGIDLSSTTDLTAASVIFRVPNDPTLYVEQMYWIPEAVLEQRVKEDKIPYDAWEEQGRVRLCQGNKINYHDVVSSQRPFSKSQRKEYRTHQHL